MQLAIDEFLEMVKDYIITSLWTKMIIYFPSDINHDNLLAAVARPQCIGVKVFSYNTLTLVITSRHSSTLGRWLTASDAKFMCDND